jgi:hypothetical protein
MPGLLRPEDLQMIASDAEMEELKREQKLSQSQNQQQREMRDAFMSRKVAPEARRAHKQCRAHRSSKRTSSPAGHYVPIQLL